MGNTANKLLVVGKIGAPYGVKGWVKITPYTEEIDGIFDYQPWLFNHHDGQRVVQIEEWRRHAKGVIAKLVGVDNRDDAEGIKNQDILIEVITCSG